MKISLQVIILILLGIFLAVAPWTIAPVCEVHGTLAQLVSGKTLPMPCGWTARAEIGIGALVIVTGVLFAFAKSPETKRIIGVFGVALGVLAILFPTYITKMCLLADHTCNTMTKPTLIVTGIVIIAVSAWTVYISRKD
jgi:hypothetical protein